MKKIIISTIFAFFGLAAMASSAHAQAVFNSPGQMPTLTVSNSTRTVCNYGPINGCWQPTTNAQPGDVVAVHVYYKNTSNTPAQGTTLSISPRSSNATTGLSFYGGVASLSGPRATGSATVTLASAQTLTYISGSAKWYPSATSGTRPVDDSALFGTSGFNIGTVNPGEQGALVAFFRVGNTTTQTYQCNDGIDNDSDGLIDYPNDPGCSSQTDNDEYNTTQSQQCVIDTFYASPTQVASGGTTTLFWNTTNCTSLTIDGVSYPVDGSGIFGPLYSGRSYQLQASGYGYNPTSSVFVNVQQINNNQCDASLYASTTSIAQGGSTTLSWSSYGLSSLSIYPTLGNQASTGSMVVYPSSSTTYTLSGYGCGTTITRTVTISVTNNYPTTQLQAITTTPSAVGQNTARLNGIAVSSYGYPTTAWFEWGTSASFGSRTAAQSVASSTSGTYYSDSISGLVPGVVYYYRAVVQNQTGTSYGEPVRFQTDRTTVVVPPKVVTQVVKNNVVVAKSAPSLLELRVDNSYERMCVNGDMNYTVTYRNVSGQTLQNAVLRITHPKELTFINSSRGDYEVVDRTVTIALGDIRPGDQGVVQVRARVNNQAISGNLAVTTATVVYTNTLTKAQEDAIAYSLITVSDDCPSSLGASAFGAGSFLPSTLLGWLLLILIILALIVIARQLYKKKA